MSSMLSVTDLYIVLTNAFPGSGNFVDEVCGSEAMNGESLERKARSSSLSHTAGIAMRF